MEFIESTNRRLLVSVFIFTFCNLGNAFDDPNLGAAGAIANGYVPQAEAGGTTQFFPQAGIIGSTSPLIFSKALHCLSNDHIYSSCSEPYRLTESGELHVPPQYTDDYCNGPCVAETHHVLDCITGIFKNFVFYNGATLNNMRDALDSGCGYGPLRGHFSILEHTQQDNGADTSMGSRLVAFVFLLMCIGWRLLF